ncbi:MAG TPA: class I SAM-dependent methyltransferase [Mycobacteriales bacterium]|nr:class I SAM-dependent methyltransferase [Mycobacteriales bacterium]
MTVTTHQPYHRPEHWDTVHARVGAGPRSRAALALHAAASAVLADRPGSGVLDVACGNGAFLRALPDRPVRIGVDLSARGLDAASRAPGAERCHWLRADAARLPLDDGSVDAAVCLSTLWVLADPARVLVELARVIRSRGLLVVHLWGRPQACRLLSLGAAVIGRVLPEMRRPEGVTGPFDLTREDVAAWAGAAGFVQTNWDVHDHWTQVDSLADYWAEFAALAPTSYATYRGASASDRRTVDALLHEFIPRAQDRGGRQALQLTWQLATLLRG